MAKIKSFGARVYVNGIAVGGLTDISASGNEVSMIDTTSHDSSGGYRTFLSGLIDGGTLDLTGRYNYADAGQAEWKAETGVTHAVYIILSDNSGLAFEAIIGGFSTTNPLDDAVEFSATAKVTGEVLPVFPTITVTGTLTSNGSTPDIIPPLAFNPSFNNGRVAYLRAGTSEAVTWTGTEWLLEGSGNYESTGTQLTPTAATGWAAVAPATGTPTLTGS